MQFCNPYLHQLSTDCMLTVYTVYIIASCPSTLSPPFLFDSRRNGAILFTWNSRVNAKCFHQGTWHGASSLLQKVLSYSCSLHFSNWASDSEEKGKWHLSSTAVVQVWSRLEQVMCRWDESRKPFRGTAVIAVMKWENERQQGGKRRQQGVEHDEFMSHIIDWQPCCADCGNRFSLGAEGAQGFTGTLHWVLFQRPAAGLCIEYWLIVHLKGVGVYLHVYLYIVNYGNDQQIW